MLELCFRFLNVQVGKAAQLGQQVERFALDCHYLLGVRFFG
jgi:hypothetical protein